ncbi:uncharacterized protein LOC127639894 isoform X2 [Xyrauchen texanus]|uniref:uncharacterized protein LOC127639894 isoform X2 n=1 Tax=Xyrauchen texanus TaxID=154827 RepID=UPI002242C193|nr:uncharacterized protein LOC127639894 isoform X2 [Xyrauchen texanus]
MKISFLFFCLSLSDGVFGDGIDEIKSVLVIEGDSVTLHTDVSEIQRVDLMVWTFGPEYIRIAQLNRVSQISSIYDVDDGRFRDRLLLNNNTGDLTITNIRIKDSGLYVLETIGEIDVLPKFYSINVFAHLPVPVIIRDSSQCSSSSKCVLVCSVVNVTHVTLSWYKGNSLLSSISVSDLNSSLSLNLEVEYQENNIYSCVINNPIRNQTKHLNITEVCQPCPVDNSKKIKEPTVYIVLISTAATGIFVVLTFVTIFCIRRKLKHQHGLNDDTQKSVKTVKAKEGESVTLNTGVTEINGFDLIQWKFGEMGTSITTPFAAIARVKIGKNVTLNSLNEDKFSGRLQLDKETGYLTITNIKTTDSGLYKMKIKNNMSKISKTFFVEVSETQGNDIEGTNTPLMNEASV